MGITNERLDEFIDRWERTFSERLSREDARSIAARLVNFYRLISRPVPAAASLGTDDQSYLEGV